MKTYTIEFDRDNTTFIYDGVQQVSRKRAAKLRRRGEFVIKLGTLRYWNPRRCECFPSLEN